MHFPSNRNWKSYIIFFSPCLPFYSSFINSLLFFSSLFFFYLLFTHLVCFSSILSVFLVFISFLFFFLPPPDVCASSRDDQSISGWPNIKCDLCALSDTWVYSLLALKTDQVSHLKSSISLIWQVLISMCHQLDLLSLSKFFFLFQINYLFKKFVVCSSKIKYNYFINYSSQYVVVFIIPADMASDHPWCCLMFWDEVLSFFHKSKRVSPFFLFFQQKFSVNAFFSLQVEIACSHLFLKNKFEDPYLNNLWNIWFENFIQLSQ